MAIDFGGSKIAAATATLDGVRIAETVVSTDPAAGARANLACGIAAARSLLGEEKPMAVGATTFGIPARYGIGLAPAIAGWERIALASELADAFDGAPVRVATDVKAAAAAETRLGALAGYDPALYLNLGTGLAAAFVVGGAVVRGADGAAGEIGYCLLGVDRPQMLEDVVSGIALARRADGLRTAADVFADAECQDVVDEFVTHLSFQLVNLAVILNPARIAVGGGIVGSWERLEPPLRAALDAHVPFPPELVLGAFPFDAALVGAIALAVEELEQVVEVFRA